MFARVIGIALGALLAAGVTTVIDPDGNVAKAVHSITQSAAQDNAGR